MHSGCCQLLLKAGAALQIANQARSKLVEFGAKTCSAVFMHLSGTKRLRWLANRWVDARQCADTEIVTTITKSSLALELSCWFNCIEINGIFAMSLADGEFWGQLGRRFGESWQTRSLTVKRATPESISVLRRHFSSMQGQISLSFSDEGQSPDERSASWDESFLWMTELLRTNQLASLKPCDACDSSPVMPTFYAALKGTKVLRSLTWVGFHCYTFTQLQDFVSALEANISLQELSLPQPKSFSSQALGRLQDSLAKVTKRNLQQLARDVSLLCDAISISSAQRCRWS
eukprot:m.31112 g.31112  ORF g.31112 m.31112 type:complete len:289 (-) comp41603_c0_seq1:1007-1873(-)